MIKLLIANGVLLLALLLFSAFSWNIGLLPALLLSALAPLLCMTVYRKPYHNPDWTLYPDHIIPSRVKAVSIDPTQLIGKISVSAEAWLPFDPVAAERYRSRSGAAALSAAIVLTDPFIASSDSTGGCTREEIAQWEEALGINPENLRALYPKLDDATFNGFSGIVVRDGHTYRAYFVGGPALIGNCRSVLEGTERTLMEADFSRLAETPANAMCYATAPVEHGKLGPLCYLGAIRPVVHASLSHNAVEAGERLHRMGLQVLLLRDHRWELQAVRDLGIDWPEDEGSADVIEIHARPERTEDVRDFAAPVVRMIEHANREIYGQLLAMMAGVALWPCCLMTASPWPLLAGLLCLCTSILLLHDQAIRSPRRYRLRDFIFPLLPGFLLPIAAMLFLSRYTESGVSASLMILAEALVYILYWNLSAIQQRRTPVLAVSVGICLVCMLLSVLLLGAELLPAAFGLIAGLLTAASILLLHRFLTAARDDENSSRS